VKAPRILLLFSGGLDSLVAARLLREIGAEVQALHFMTPFTGKESGLAGEKYLAEWGIELQRFRISLSEYLPLLTSQRDHGIRELRRDRHG
jgi:tRNA-specific 2-thiouridylase